MSQSWKPLPADLSEPARRLAEELRAVKDAHRISLADLGKRTHLSKASWERWLNGKRLITSQALSGLIAAVECDAALLTSLLRQAEAARDTEAAPAAVPISTPAPVPTPAPPVEAVEPAASPDPSPSTADADTAGPALAGWRRPATLLGVAVVAAFALFAALYPRGTHDDRTGSQPVAAATTPTAPTPCQGVGCAGKDPQTQGCDLDERTLLTGNVGEAILYVHYSPRCRAAWAGITNGSPGDSATITTNTGEQETALIHWGYDNYSVMVDAGPGDTTLQVCGHRSGGAACTSVVNDPAARASAMPVPKPPAPATTPAP
ncbi:transcriptional regulator with XRE-family HTH domain [Kitasatospora sp. MAA19]|uniref:DUF2690 domain-containing protein n=1 Tax=unclassified Kitasatospora TaxID=2633591 RepID=UPI002476046E|nr:DUF2690 domain-containing protein [Kitasatospora sp. MAA19]MDH6708825.1 transcriptional regulator with XRE-family HTH domain [Kitasatospora sp. MAA19]